MVNELKLIIGVVACLILLFGVLIHSKTRATQLLLKELGIEATYWEAVGTDQDFVKGRLIERQSR